MKIDWDHSLILAWLYGGLVGIGWYLIGFQYAVFIAFVLMMMTLQEIKEKL